MPALKQKIAISLLLLSITPSVLSSELKSGYEFLTPMSREMQDDEFSNPGMSTVDKGRNLFNEKGVNDKTCADCHGKEGEIFNAKSLARYPIYDDDENRPITLQEKINLCGEDQLDNVPYVPECIDLVALETFVRYLARGEAINVDISGPMKKHYDAGEKLYFSRIGQYGMSCAHCHVYNQGKKLRGQTLSQGQTNGFPEYRLGPGKVVGIHTRVQECFSSFRAEPYGLGSEELINLEVYLNAKGNSLKVETPAVRY